MDTLHSNNQVYEYISQNCSYLSFWSKYPSTQVLASTNHTYTLDIDINSKIRTIARIWQLLVFGTTFSQLITLSVEEIFTDVFLINKTTFDSCGQVTILWKLKFDIIAGFLIC